jgi:hypothetical protein
MNLRKNLEKKERILLDGRNLGLDSCGRKLILQSKELEKGKSGSPKVDVLFFAELV